MKKRLMIVALLACLVAVPAFSAPRATGDFSLGVQVGYPTVVAATADINFNQDWFMIADAGLLVGNGIGIEGDVLINWNFATVDGFRNGDAWEFSAGAGTGLGGFFGSNGYFSLTPKGDIRALYAFSEGWDVFVRVDLGVNLLFNGSGMTTGFGFNGALGCTYAFN